MKINILALHGAGVIENSMMKFEDSNLKFLLSNFWVKLFGTLWKLELDEIHFILDQTLFKILIVR